MFQLYKKKCNKIYNNFLNLIRLMIKFEEKN
jgi:hypothetical protein